MLMYGAPLIAAWIRYRVGRMYERLVTVALWIRYHWRSRLVFVIGVAALTLPGTFPVFNNPLLGGVAVVAGILIVGWGFALSYDDSMAYAAAMGKRYVDDTITDTVE